MIVQKPILDLFFLCSLNMRDTSHNQLRDYFYFLTSSIFIKNYLFVGDIVCKYKYIG